MGQAGPGLEEKWRYRSVRDQPFLLALPPDLEEEPEDREEPELDRPEEPERLEDDPPDRTEPEERLDEEPPERGEL
jgi:hypothetical protein